MPDIKSHFVPKFYLENFGETIHVYDKMNESSFQTNAKNIGYEKNIYGKPDENNKHELEFAMSRLESKANVAILEVIQNESFSSLSDENKDALCGFTALQYLRTQEARLRITELKEKVINEIAKHMGVTDWKVKVTEEGKTASHLNMMKDYLPIANVLRNMNVTILKNETDKPLWSSDNPVTLHNETEQFPWGNLGLASKGIEIHLPLSPTIGVAFLDPSTYPKLDILSVDDQIVIRENHLQTMWSTRFVYSNTNEFDMMNNYLHSEPEIKNPGKQRISPGIHEMKPEDYDGKAFHEKPKFWFDPKELDKMREQNDKD